MLSCILVLRISILALVHAIVRILVSPIWFVGLACCSFFVVPEGLARRGPLAVLFFGFPDLLFSPGVEEEASLLGVDVCALLDVLCLALFALLCFC